MSLTSLGAQEPLDDSQLLLLPAGPGSQSAWRVGWTRFRRDPVALASLIVIGLLIVMAVLAPVLTAINGHPPDAEYQNHLDPLLGGLPSGSVGGVSGSFWFGLEPGTGRDLFSMIVYGARVSLFVSVSATIVTVVVATLMGITAGFFGGWIDTIISRLMDLLLAFPSLIFMIALVAVLPSVPRLLLLIIILSVFGWPYLGRIVRGETMSLREREFVEAARAMGAPVRYTLLRELLPNLLTPIIVTSMLTVPTYITAEAGLSFLGLGIEPPTPSWGSMLANSLNWYATDPWYFIFPGFFLFLAVFSFNMAGDGLQRALDPRGD
ncbi:MAG TPA: ABC transporter permease [Acidimicrobiales bacterium]|nr:ABC transporter permease [Acidimicrobiales bacterium]